MGCVDDSVGFCLALDVSEVRRILNRPASTVQGKLPGKRWPTSKSASAYKEKHVLTHLNIPSSRMASGNCGVGRPRA